MILIQFTKKDAQYTWFINDNWILIISFLSTVLLGLIYKKIKNSRKKIQEKNLRGGDFIDTCIDPNGAYEILDPNLEITVKQMLKLQPTAEAVIISVPVAILAYIVSQKPLRQISVLGINVVVSKAANLGLKTAIGFAGGLSLFVFPPGVITLTTGLLAGAMMYNVIQDISKFECDNIMSKLSVERNTENKLIGFIEKPKHKNPRVYIKGNKDIELYSITFNEDEYCVSESKQEVKKLDFKNKQAQIQIHRKCKRKYVPLKHRTKTLSDLRREDSTENRQQALPFINRYEERKNRIRNTKESPLFRSNSE